MATSTLFLIQRIRADEEDRNRLHLRWALEQPRGRTLCPHCERLRFDLYPEPIHVRLEKAFPRRSWSWVGPTSVLGWRSRREWSECEEYLKEYCVFKKEGYVALRDGARLDPAMEIVGPRIGLINARFRAVLEPYLKDYFVFGEVYDAKGRRIEAMNTLYSGECIRERGQAGSRWETCPGCGRGRYFQRGSGYVLCHQLTEGRHVYQDGFCRLWVDEYLAEQIDWGQFRDLELLPFPVIDRPLDGLRLPGDPDWESLPPLSEEERRRVTALFDEAAEPAPGPPEPKVAKKPRLPSRERIEKALKRQGLAAEAVEFLLGRLRPGFRLARARAGRNVGSMASIPLGSSRLGGVPDLPVEWEWPRAGDGRPLAFVAQLDLGEVSEVGLELEVPLPERGYLYFFYDAQEQPGGSGPESCGGWQVLYSSARLGEIQRRAGVKDLPEYCRFLPRRVQLRPMLYLPSAETLEEEFIDPVGPGTPLEEIVRGAVEPLVRARRGEGSAGGGPGGPLASLRAALEEGRYGDWAAKLNGVVSGEPDHRFLGHPQEEQSSMPVGFARLVADRPEQEFAHPHRPGQVVRIPGRRAEDWPGWARELLGQTRAEEWRLLLQLDSEGGWMWGDCGKLYFWIPRGALAAREFEKTWVELQCGLDILAGVRASDRLDGVGRRQGGAGDLVSAPGHWGSRR